MSADQGLIETIDALVRETYTADEPGAAVIAVKNGDIIKYRPMHAAPGKRWRYNNSGYFLLGVIIEKVSGVSAEIMHRKEAMP